jgi:hypothetical protein
LTITAVVIVVLGLLLVLVVVTVVTVVVLVKRTMMLVVMVFLILLFFRPLMGKTRVELSPSKNEFIEFFFLIYRLDNLILLLICVKILRIF